MIVLSAGLLAIDDVTIIKLSFKAGATPFLSSSTVPTYPPVSLEHPPGRYIPDLIYQPLYV